MNGSSSPKSEIHFTKFGSYLYSSPTIHHVQFSLFLIQTKYGWSSEGIWDVCSPWWRLTSPDQSETSIQIM